MGFPNKNIVTGIIVVLLLVTGAHAQERNSFVLVPKGQYTVGKKGHMLNPFRRVAVDSFWIAAKETTNAQFAAFVTATSYKTDAEKKHDALVYKPGLKEFEWFNDTTAYWRYPHGLMRGSIDGKMDHPVTCISYSDILAYCRWAGVRLPSLDEWEIACRAGSNTDFFFGNDTEPLKTYANTWHGKDHLTPDSTDGYIFTSPAGSFAPNAWGLYDVYGNVFEFCTGKLKSSTSNTVAYARGGSWWCSRNACHFFNSYDIGRVHIHASFSNQGFRVVK